MNIRDEIDGINNIKYSKLSKRRNTTANKYKLFQKRYVLLKVYQSCCIIFKMVMNSNIIQYNS